MIPGSGRLLRHASRHLGGRMVRELGLPNMVGAALGIPGDEAPAGDGSTSRRRKREIPRRPLHMIDKATEQAIGERAFQASLAYLDEELPLHVGTSVAQAIAHAVVEALDEYLLRAQKLVPAPTDDATRGGISQTIYSPRPENGPV